MAKDDKFWGVIGEIATPIDPPLKVRTTAESDKRAGWFHFRHRWVNVEARHMVSAEFGHITRVLQRCTTPGCAEVRTPMLHGYWTLEQINGGVR